MQILLLVAALAWCAIFGITLFFTGWFWSGLALLLAPVVFILWFIWGARL